MDNPAEYMLQFFNCEEREDGFDDNISKAFGQMHDTETCLNDLLSMNVRRLDTAKSVMPGIWEKLWASYANAQGNGALVSFDMKPRRELTLDAAQRQANDCGQNAGATHETVARQYPIGRGLPRRSHQGGEGR